LTFLNRTQVKLRGFNSSRNVSPEDTRIKAADKKTQPSTKVTSPEIDQQQESTNKASNLRKMSRVHTQLNQEKQHVLQTLLNCEQRIIQAQ